MRLGLTIKGERIKCFVPKFDKEMEGTVVGRTRTRVIVGWQGGAVYSLPKATEVELVEVRNEV